MKKNNGYSLVEMVIVIAIMAILAGVSFITIGIIRNAKQSAAASTLNDQLGSCIIQTKAISDNGSKRLCMLVKKNTNGQYAIQFGYLSGSDLKNMDTNVVLDSGKVEDCQAILSKEVTKIVYKPAGGGTELDDNLMIRFSKSDGSVVAGAGEYDLYGRDNKVFSTIVLDKVTGNHFKK